MSDLRDKWLLKILKWISFCAMLITGIMGGLFVVGTFCQFTSDNPQKSTVVYPTFSIEGLPGESINLELDEGPITRARIEANYDHVWIDEISISYRIISAIIVTIYSVLVVLLLYLLHRLLGRIQNKHPFEKENFLRLKKIGYIMVLMEIIYRSQYFIAKYFYINRMAITDDIKMKLHGFDRLLVSIDINWTLILTGLGIILLAEVFRIGWRMHEEQKLTV